MLDDAGEAVADSIGESAAYQRLDVGDEDGWRLALDASQRWGPVNVLLNNAAVLFHAPLTDTSPADYERVARVNQLGVFLGMRAVVDSMKAASGDSIINMSSVDGMRAKNGALAYIASKWAVRGMSKAAAIELGRYGIRVNSVHPGGIDTPMGNPGALDAETLNQAVFKRFPLARIAQPLEVAHMTLFLASDDSSYCTGAEFIVDGGWTAGDFFKQLPTS